MRSRAKILAAGLLLALPLLGQTAGAGEKYSVMLGGGAGPGTGARGEVGAIIRISDGIYSLTTMNMAGGVGAVVQDVLYRAATNRGVTLWARGGAGASTTNTDAGTSTSPTFGGGGMLSYDLSKISDRLAGLEVYASVKAMYVTVIIDSKEVTAVKPQYLFGLKFNWGGN